MNQTSIGDWIRSRRLKLGLSQAQLARRMKADAASISRWERGITEPRAAQIRRLVAELGSTADKALGLVAAR